MAEAPLLKRKLHALLIGVDYYIPHKLADGSYYPSLGGCVRDINHVETFLKQRLELPDEQIIKLTSTNGKDGPPEPKEKWPTYENMVAAFKQTTQRAVAGDQVYIHYSGHGGRTVTAFREAKGEKALDESLVPIDIGEPGTRYLRDLDMAHLLKEMTDKDLLGHGSLRQLPLGGRHEGGG